MFYSKITPNIPTSGDGPDPSPRPASPTNSVRFAIFSPAPSQAPKSSIFTRFQRASSSYSSVSSVADMSKSTEAVYSAKYAALRAEIVELQELLTLNQLTMRGVLDDLQQKELECAGLRRANSVLDAELKQAVQPIIATTGSDHLALSNKATDGLADLELTIKEKDEQVSTILTELETTKLSQAKLVREHTECSHNARTQQDQIISLQKENEVLATRTAVAESNITKYTEHMATFAPQFRSLVTLTAASQAKHSTEIDAIHAKYQQSNARFTQQIQDKDALIASLQSRLADKETKSTACNANESYKPEAAYLVGQLSRLSLQASGSNRQKTAWPKYTT